MRAAALTDGAVDPTVGSALCALGYDRDFSALADGVDRPLPPARPVPGWQTVTLDAERRAIGLLPGTVLDLGATAKAWAADRACAAIAGQLECGVLVSLGGDLAVANAPDGGFSVGIADVCGDQTTSVQVSVASGGLATSGIGRRHWMLGGHLVHHLVNPETGRPVDSYWRTVSVAAGSCVDANTASTAAMVKGVGAVTWLEAAIPARPTGAHRRTPSDRRPVAHRRRGRGRPPLRRPMTATAALVGAASNGKALWYLTRSTGLVALVLLTASVVLGVVASVGWTTERWPRFLSQDVHRNLSLFCVGFVAIHVVTTVSDGYVPIGFVDAFIPFLTPYRPLYVGLGALGFDLLLAVLITSALRHKIGFASWRFVHWLAYLCFPIALFHSLGSGTDAPLPLVLLLDAVCAAAVVAVMGWRLVTGRTFTAGQRAAAVVGTVVVGLGLLVFAALGPLRPGWSHRSGTSAALLAQLAKKNALEPDRRRPAPRPRPRPPPVRRPARPPPHRSPRRCRGPSPPPAPTVPARSRWYWTCTSRTPDPRRSP